MTGHALHTVAAQLPTHIDDTAPINEAFMRWQQAPEARDKRLIDLWTYCYVYRYFLIKFAPSSQHTPLCFDRLVARTFADVQEHLSSIRRPGHYTGWVGTICRNTFVNYLRAKRSTISFEEGVSTLVVQHPDTSEAHDAVVVHQTICAAIDALPSFLRDITRMRLVEDRSYVAIGEETGKSIPTLRAYINKALVQLRQNPTVRTLFEEMCD